MELAYYLGVGTFQDFMAMSGMDRRRMMTKLIKFTSDRTSKHDLK